jgi:hypothetical protein
MLELKVKQEKNYNLRYISKLVYIKTKTKGSIDLNHT